MSKFGISPAKPGDLGALDVHLLLQLLLHIVTMSLNRVNVQYLYISLRMPPSPRPHTIIPTDTHYTHASARTHTRTHAHTRAHTFSQVSVARRLVWCTIFPGSRVREEIWP